MTDIVKRLRSPVSQENDIFLGQRPGEEVKSYDVVRFDGSYEIERLRAALREIASTERDSCSEWFQDIAIAALEGK